jgi:hypothetical protein
MRENGGWTNWAMEIVHFFNCNDHYEARIKEQEYFVLLKATLNSIEPMPKPKPTIKTTPNVIEMPENASKYHCKTCDFNTHNYTNYERHIITRKHNHMTNVNQFTEKHDAKFICNKCNKCYKARNGLWYHNQKCQPIVDVSDNFVSDKELLMSILKQNSEIIKENSELKNLMAEVLKTSAHLQH